MHFGAVVSGAHTWPLAQPAPIAVAAQNRLVCAQVTAPGVAAPCGVHEPFRMGVNGPAWTPAIVPKLLPTHDGVVHACVEVNDDTSSVPCVDVAEQSAAVLKL